MFGKLFVVILCVAVFMLAFAACAEEKPEIPEKTVYTVTFDANGGTYKGAIDVEVEEGGKIDAPEVSRKGYTFEGWYTAAVGGDKLDLENYKVSKDVTVYAQWSRPEQTYTVTFDANGGTLDGEASVAVTSGGKVTEVPVASNGDLYFVSWYTEKVGGQRIDLSAYTVTSDITLYAHWITYLPKVTITLDGNGGEVAGNTSVLVRAGQKMDKPTATKRGYVNSGWSTDAQGTELIDFDTYIVNEADTLYAIYDYASMPLSKAENVYTVEAENAIIGGIPSDTNKHFIENNIASASGKTTVGFLGKAGNNLTFTFYAEAAGTAQIDVYMTSNKLEGSVWWPADDPDAVRVVDQEIGQDTMKVELNDNGVAFENQIIPGAEKPLTWNEEFHPVTLGDTLDIVEGLNVVYIESKSSSMPNVDCLKITTDVAIKDAVTADESAYNTINFNATEGDKSNYKYDDNKYYDTTVFVRTGDKITNAPIATYKDSSKVFGDGTPRLWTAKK